MTTTPSSTSRVLWHGGCRSTFLQQASLGLVLIGIVVNVAWVPWLGISIGIVGLVLFPLVVIQAQVTEDAFHIFYSGRLRWPVQTIRLADVVAVEAIDVVPMKHGGWGYWAASACSGEPPSTSAAAPASASSSPATGPSSSPSTTPKKPPKPSSPSSAP